mgnify:CR=1 FL=1
MLGGSAAALAAAGAAPRPNFVFILVDDLRYDALGCTGHPFVKSPNVDRLAREGMNFTNAFVTTPLCSPARGSFLTGQYVRTHGIMDNSNRSEASHKLVTFPKLLRDAGYETAYVGKWHMGNDATPRPGFDKWVSFPGQGQYTDPRMNIDGNAIQAQGYMTDLLNNHAVEFIRKPHSKPFCLYLAHKAVHGPFTPAERHKSLYEGAKIERRPSAKDTLEGKPALKKGLAAEAQVVRKKNAAPAHSGPSDETILNQLRCLSSIDDGVGLIYEALKATGQLDNTLIVFTSDNGYLWGEHGLGDKRAFYEESIRIPMVARYPKLIRAGSRTKEMALNIDIAPTFLDLAGAKVPSGMQGRSLRPVMAGQAKTWRKSFLGEYYEEKQFPRIATWDGVRTERYKLTRYASMEGADELYDLDKDPYEMKNLAQDPAAKGILKEMQAELEKLRKEIQA